MSIMDNKSIVCEFFNHLEKGNVESMIAVVDESVRWWVQGKGDLDKAGICSNFQKLVSATEERSVKVRKIFAEEDQVYAYVETRFVFKTGGVLRNRIGLALGMRAGKVVEATEYMDTDNGERCLDNGGPEAMGAGARSA